MKLKEVPGKAMEWTKDKLNDQLERRRNTLETDKFKAECDQIKKNIEKDLLEAGSDAFYATLKLTIGAPVMALWKGLVTEPGKIFLHNQSVKNKKNKKEYPEVPAVILVEALKQYGDGLIDVKNFFKNVISASGRASALGFKNFFGI